MTGRTSFRSSLPSVQSKSITTVLKFYEEYLFWEKRYQIQCDPAIAHYQGQVKSMPDSEVCLLEIMQLTRIIHSRLKKRGQSPYVACMHLCKSPYRSVHLSKNVQKCEKKQSVTDIQTKRQTGRYVHVTKNCMPFERFSL